MMRTNYYIWFIWTISSLLLGACADKDISYKVETFEVPLDHFSYAVNTTFKIRYLINNTYANSDPDSIILFYTGNEGDIELYAKNTGFMWDRASELKAMLVFAEHRYYGQSLPFGNKSFDSPEHLGYLSSEQALADYADLVQFLNPNSTKPVIAIGGSYGGILSAWFRMKYPHLVTGAIASSAPILQFGNITPCEIFYRIVTSVFATAYKKECTDNIRKSWTVLRNLAQTPEGRTAINRKFNLCSNLTKATDIDDFFDYLKDVYGNLAMANYPYNADFLAPLPAYPVREFCWRLSKITNDTQLIDDLYSALSVYSNYTGKTKCLDISSAYDSSIGSKAWDFQSCTEMVMPICSTGTTDMFEPESWDIKKYSEKCFQKFKVHPKPDAAVITYGGENIKYASNIVFSNGLLDPWSGGGVLRTPNDKIQIIIIPEGAHHLDLRRNNPNDPNSVKEARLLLVRAIKSWI